MEELCWCPDKLFYLHKDTDIKVNCNITYYLAYCELPDHKLVLGEGQAMKWFTVTEVMHLDNICRPSELRLIIKKAHKRIKSL